MTEDMELVGGGGGRALPACTYYSVISPFMAPEELHVRLSRFVGRSPMFSDPEGMRILSCVGTSLG